MINKQQGPPPPPRHVCAEQGADDLIASGLCSDRLVWRDNKVSNKPIQKVARLPHNVEDAEFTQPVIHELEHVEP